MPDKNVKMYVKTFNYLIVIKNSYHNMYTLGNYGKYIVYTMEKRKI